MWPMHSGLEVKKWLPWLNMLGIFESALKGASGFGVCWQSVIAAKR
jgi:hypothetical protein